MRSTIIFGNGLGMALDPRHFALHDAMLQVWNNADYLSSEHKELIISAIPGATQTNPPSSEWQLDQIHAVIAATKYISGYEKDGARWLTEHAKQLPTIFKKFIHNVALHLALSGKFLPGGFSNSLSEYIHASKSHVATLNYDSLLYDALQTTYVLNGYDGPLIDGFTNKGFGEDNLVRYYPQQKGWYMHLHGSPLYIGNMKAQRADRAFIDPNDDNHIVLSHVEHKPYYISQSKILSTYWKFFEQALGESEHVVLFGYSGEDKHLNSLIRSRPQTRVLIVEWNNSSFSNERFSFWTKLLEHNNYNLWALPNVLEFRGWDGSAFDDKLRPPMHN